MREIKFRAWDRQDKVMTISRDFNSWLDAFAQAEYDSMTNFNDRASQFIWLQYTGLKDKNGKEIYEGDIVRIKNPVNQIQKASIISEIGFYDAAFCAYWRKTELWEGYHVSPSSVVFMNIMSSEQIEIIGNIYEKEQPTAIVSDLINYSDSTDTVKNQ